MKLSEVPIGAIVEYPRFKYLDETVQLQIVSKDHYTKDSGYPKNAVTLQTKDLISAKALDAKEVNNSDSGRKSYGNNNFYLSNLKQWLNSDEIEWYSPQHQFDAPPTEENLYLSYYPYVDEPGFMTNIPLEFKDTLLSTRISTAVASIDGGGSKNGVMKIFIPSATETGAIGIDSTAFDGVVFDYYTSEGSWVKKMTRSASSKFLTATNSQFTRTPSYSSSYFVYEARENGDFNKALASRSTICVAPIFNVPNDLDVKQVGEKYIIYNLLDSQTGIYVKINNQWIKTDVDVKKKVRT